MPTTLKKSEGTVTEENMERMFFRSSGQKDLVPSLYSLVAPPQMGQDPPKQGFQFTRVPSPKHPAESST